MTKYSDFDRNFMRDEVKGEHCLYMSSLWNEKYEEKYFHNNPKCSRQVLATLFLSGWHVRPVKDSKGEIIGSHCLYLYSADANGMIP